MVANPIKLLLKLAIFSAILATPIPMLSPAEAAERYSLVIPSGNLSQSISRLSSQSGASIGSVDVSLNDYRASALRGKYTLRQALKKLLRNTDLDFVVLNERTARIIRRPARTVARPVSKKQEPGRGKSAVQAPPTTNIETPIIVVTASKQGSPLKDFAGSAVIVDIATAGQVAESEGLEGLISRLPTTAQTNLGLGRNKLFLRGIADSSLIGTTQSTIGLYMDETRLSYSGSNPDLRTYDQSRVEVLEGPQGTLFGAGTIGGIIKIVTNKPEPDAVSGAVWSSLGASEGGGASYDLASMVNLPVNENLAVRAVGYYQHDGGYIDDVGRDLNNVNSSEVFGGRLALRYQNRDNWIVDLNLLHQSNETRDGQYSERDQLERTRSSLVAQPFDGDFSSGSLTASKQWDKFKLISSLAYVEQRNFSTFDASILSPTMAAMTFNEEIKGNLLTHETRLSWRSDSGHSAVVGIAYLDNRDIVTLEMGTPDAPERLSQTENDNLEAALFGEASYQVSDDITASLGGRLAYSKSVAEVVIDGGQELDPSRARVRLLPKAALAWKPDSNGLIYASYQEGFRSGGISIGLGANNPITQFASDTIQTSEAGIKIGRRADSRFSADFAFFYSKWNNIQADLIDEAGFPRTTNIGNGLVYGVSLGANWAVTDHLSVYGRYFANESELTEAAANFVVGDESRLPNIAEMGANVGWVWALALSDNRELTFQSDIRYVGTSQLGIDPFLSLEQGKYVLVNSSAQYQINQWKFSLNVNNLFNSEANSFALGNPFSVADGLQITPLRPRTVTLGVKVKL
ncbi:MAG: TonB-dependent receptor [Parasphingorhabdus sp.]|uniref:TonB-dependent receptor n=1 Tax=Parasphingorhabdus sp. TaxID=2709688 RepID=UPI0030034B74